MSVVYKNVCRSIIGSFCELLKGVRSEKAPLGGGLSGTKPCGPFVLKPLETGVENRIDLHHFTIN